MKWLLILCRKNSASDICLELSGCGLIISYFLIYEQYVYFEPTWFPSVDTVLWMFHDDSFAVTWAESDVTGLPNWCQTVDLNVDGYVVGPPYVRPHFSYLSIFLFLFLGSWCLTVKYWHWNYILFDRLLCCVLIFYEYNLYFYKLLVVLTYYWSLRVTSIKLLSHWKVIFTVYDTDVCYK